MNGELENGQEQCWRLLFAEGHWIQPPDSAMVFYNLICFKKKRTAGPKPMHAIHKPKQFSSGWKGGMKSNMCCSQQKEKFFKMWNIGFLPCIAYFNPTSWDIFIKEEPKFPIFSRSIIVLPSPPPFGTQRR